MKIISNLKGSLLDHMNRQGVFSEVMSYEELYDFVMEDDVCDVIVVDISNKNAEGIYTPRRLIENGHGLPIIGVLDELEVGDEHEFEDAQASFIEQGGLYLLKSTSSPSLLKACIQQAGTVASRRLSQRVPVRSFTGLGISLIIDLRSALVKVNGIPIHLTKQEYLMLELLAIRTGSVVTKESFLGHLYGGMDIPDIKIIDVFLCKLRRKLGPAGQYIETVWGRGYVLRENPAQKEAAE